MVRSSIGQEPVSTTTMDTLTPVPDPTRASTAGTEKAAGERTRARHLVRGVEPGPFSLRPLPPFRLMGGPGVSGAGMERGPTTRVSLSTGFFLLSPAETIHPRAGTIPWGLVIFTSGFLLPGLGWSTARGK